MMWPDEGHSHPMRPASDESGSIQNHEQDGRDFRDEQTELSDSTTSFPSGMGQSDSERPPQSVNSFPSVVVYGPHWSAKRHLTCGNPSPTRFNFSNMPSWRLKDKLKTANAALVVCLNIDVDPPDVVKTDPCAVLECWIDPRSMPSNKAIEAIGNNLQHQFEAISPRMKWKPYLDPSYDDAHKFCAYLRKMAREERCLFYYNGHGVPKPTPSGELWVFNKSYSQYIPVSLAEVQNWLGSPCVYIWDCSAAGNLLTNFNIFAEKRDTETNMLRGGYPDGMQPFSESLQLAACLAHEQLPMCPDLPADVFTSCLTSPIDMALRWYVMMNQLPSNVTVDMVHRIPGDLRDRRTPLGELNWIFTAITDTIAWTSFPREIFTRLYRSDLLVASLFRNFLLAERIMKNYHCTPHTHPPLPPTNTHAMWASWDLAIDDCLRQLPFLLPDEKHAEVPASRETSRVPTQNMETPYVYVPNRFFADHLTAFEVWLSRGGSALTKRGPNSMSPATTYDIFGEEEDIMHEHKTSNGIKGDDVVPRKPPDQLPIVLQVLLSQQHRSKALVLLSQFVDLGPWAVYLALTIGIFPYISKLLQAPAPELRPVLIFIWARILAVDPSCQVDLFTNHGYRYFANVLAQSTIVPNSSEHRAMCCFILASVCRGYTPGQNVCLHERVFDTCFERLEEDDFLLRQWMALCIGQMWDGNDDVKVHGVDRGTQDKLISMAQDDSPEVRCAALFALGTFLGASGSAESSQRGGGGTGSMSHLDERTHFRLEIAVGTGAAVATKDDISPMVRKELLILLSCIVKEWRGHFVIAAWLYWEEERKRIDGAGHLHDEDVTEQAISEWLDSLGDDDAYREESRILLSSFCTLYMALLELSVDPYPEIAGYGKTIVDYITALLLESPFTRLEGSSLDSPPSTERQVLVPEPRRRVPSLQSGTSLHGTRTPVTRSNSPTNSISSGGANILRRTASFANSLRNLAGAYAFPSLSTDDGSSSAHTLPASRMRAALSDQSNPPSPHLDYTEYTSPYAFNGSDDARFSPSPRSSIEDHQQSMDYMPFDVIEALIEEDMERLRMRRAKKTQRRQHHHRDSAGGDGMPSPSDSTFSHDSIGSVLLGLGTGAGIKGVLPLKSRFYDWCCEYFKETQMKQPESEEPGSVQYNEQMWRRQRNEKIILETRAQASIASSCKWERPVASIQHSGTPVKMVFHGYDPYLFVSNETNAISVYNWTTRKRLTSFKNGNPSGTCITSLHCINQDVGGILMAGSSDGIVHLYRNYDDYTEHDVQTVTSFRALNHMLPIKRGSGLVLDWQQSPGVILAGGNSRIIRAWDAHRECALFELDTDSDSPVTSICSDPDSSIFMAGFGDGMVKIFDRRLNEDDAVVRVYRGHASWVQSTRWQRGIHRGVLTASLDGDVRLWDVRAASTALGSWSLFSEGLSAFDVHDQSHVFAASSALTSTRWRQQTIVVHSLCPRQQPSVLSRISVPTGLYHAPPRIPPASSIPSHTSLIFHPTEMIMGIGGADGMIKLIGCKLVEKREDDTSTNGYVSSERGLNGHLPYSGSLTP